MNGSQLEMRGAKKPAIRITLRLAGLEKIIQVQGYGRCGGIQPFCTMNGMKGAMPYGTVSYSPHGCRNKTGVSQNQRFNTHIPGER